jgi:DNA excision repair protein ERCC-4
MSDRPAPRTCSAHRAERDNPLVARPRATPVKIIVDVHERQSGIAETLAELGAEIEIALLPAGDYAVGADTLVERKRVLDLHAAVLKGRLWPQLGKLRAACSFPYLLVEGSDIDRGPLHHNAVRGVCLAVIDQGIALLRTGYQRDSALWIHRLAVRCQEVEPAADRPIYTQRPRPKPGEETAEALLSAVPGISTSCARALLARFRSVAGVLAAGPAEWLEVPGIGPERARALEETFHFGREMPAGAGDD